MALNLAKKIYLKDFVASEGYITRFKKRHNLKCKSIIGESGMVDKSSINNFLEIYDKKLNAYSPEKPYNCDKTGLFWKEGPKKTIVLSKKDKASGNRQGKE